MGDLFQEFADNHPAILGGIFIIGTPLILFCIFPLLFQIALGVAIVLVFYKVLAFLIYVILKRMSGL